MILDGWPKDLKISLANSDPPKTHCNLLTVEDRIIPSGEAVVVPPGREDVLNTIYEGHQGITKCHLQAKNCVHWPGVNMDTQQSIKGYET